MKRFLAIIAVALLPFTATTTAQPIEPYHYDGYRSGLPYGWGYYPFANWINIQPYQYGYNYYPYWNYNPRYETFGAIAYSVDTGQVGYSWGFNTRFGALDAADYYCAADDCRGVVWVRGGCAALALDEDQGAIAYSYTVRRYAAERYALRSCRASGGTDCHIGAWVCSY